MGLNLWRIGSLLEVVILVRGERGLVGSRLPQLRWCWPSYTTDRNVGQEDHADTSYEFWLLAWRVGCPKERFDRTQLSVNKSAVFRRKSQFFCRRLGGVVHDKLHNFTCLLWAAGLWRQLATVYSDNAFPFRSKIRGIWDYSTYLGSHA